MIEEGNIVFINSGTTATQVISTHPPRCGHFHFYEQFECRAWKSGNRVSIHHLLGGEYQPVSNSSAGRFAIENLRQIYANIAIIGVDGISLKHGCTVPANAEAEVVHRMIERTKGQVIIVADHSKWGVVSNFQIATIDEIDRLITDERLDSSAVESLAAHNVDCMIAAFSTVQA